MRYWFKIIKDFFKRVGSFLILRKYNPIQALDIWVDSPLTTSSDIYISRNRYLALERSVLHKDRSFVLQYVQYNNQRNNPEIGDFGPATSCYPTSIAMVLRTLEQQVYGGEGRVDYLKEELDDIILEDLFSNNEVYIKVRRRLLGSWADKIAPGFIAGFWVWYINNKIPGYKAKYHIFTWNGLKEFIRGQMIPLVIETKLTPKGHIIVCKGFNSAGFYCNDPYGDAEDYSRYPSPDSGRGVYYKNEMMKRDIGSVVITHAKDSESDSIVSEKNV